MFGDLVSTRVRRLLYLSSALLLLAAVAVRMLLGGEGGKTQVARELASSVAGAVIVWTLGLLFLGVFLAREKQARETRVIDGDASAKHFTHLVSEATFWFHHGQIGRWVRENALPALVARSRRSPAPLRMVLILLDPSSEAVCKIHADRRNSKRRKESTPYTAFHIQSEIASTILAVAKAKASIPNFDARVFVSQLDLPFRLDLCDDYGLITHEDQTAPAFGFEPESPYYATACAYFERAGTAQGREIDLDVVSATIPSLTARSVTMLLTTLGIGFSGASDKAASSGIVAAVNEAVS